MYRLTKAGDPFAELLDFRLRDVAGEWESLEGAPRIRIYRNPDRKSGGFYIELSYNADAVFRLPIKKYWGGIRYFDLYGLVALAYDASCEVLQLSVFGDYYRKS